MKYFLNLKSLFLIAGVLLLENFALAQRASVSIPIGVARNSCNGGSSVMAYYNYNEITNSLTTASVPTSCTPQLRIGATTFNYTADLSSVSYNPADTSLYYLWSDLFNTFGPVRTYIWKWSVGSCPTSTSPRLDTLRSFAFDILGVTYDNNGGGYLIEFEGTAAPYRAFLRSIDFTSGAIGQRDTLALTNNKVLYATGTGDLAISPSGRMFFACNNKLFGIEYQNYGTPARKITSQYIDTLTVNPSAPDLVALTYAQGKLISGYAGGSSCVAYEINPTVQNDIPIAHVSTNRAVDGASLINSIGVAKSLTSAVMVNPSTYDLTYHVLIKNIGTFPLYNVQAFDTLTKINPAGVVSNVNISFIQNPGGAFALNAGFNGSTSTNLLTANGAALRNYPISANSIIIQINCRINGLGPGIEYRNRAFATATGFRNQPLRDTSTNGTNPDLDGNGVADNIGESRPTPFYIPAAPVSGVCNSFATTFYTQNFGTVTGMSNTIPNELSKSSAPLTNYAGVTASPVLANRFTRTNNSSLGNPTEWVTGGDNSGTPNGAMLAVNADLLTNIIYKDTVDLCGGHEYSVSLYAKDITTAAQMAICNATTGYNFPRLRIRLIDPIGNLLIGQVVTPFLSTNWQQYGFRWVMPSSINQVYFEILNDGNGGCGNDLAIDDILIATCSADPTISLSASSVCTGSPVTFTANLTNSSVIPGRKTFQLEVSSNGISGWTIVNTSQTSTYTISSTTLADLNKYYRYAVADSASGNINSTTCRFISPSQFLAGSIQSLVASSLVRGRQNVCPGQSFQLRAIGGDSGTMGTWQWYTGSCGGTLVGTGRTITVSPFFNTTYYLRATGACNTTTCISIPITFNCDIDDDNDGIPDLLEHNNVDIETDRDFDGTVDYLDSDTPGFIDSNFDGVDDRYDPDLDGLINQFDRDSDNDGIPDVVESFGVDVNGDGIIDDYTDGDGDGFSNNVDATKLTGWFGSGEGLGNIDLDGDGLPNFLDLDSDGDGIPDIVEAGGSDAANLGRINGSFTDSSPQDGFHDSWDLGSCILITGADTDATKDGRPNSVPNDNMDGDGRSNPYDLDSDGDGLTDVIEQMYARWVAFNGTGANATVIWDGNLDGKADGPINANGYTTAIKALSSLTIYNSDASASWDTRPDYLDIDSDNDGITDNIEGQTTFTTGANYRLPTTTDTDNDGIADVYENAGDIGSFRGGNINPLNIDGDLRADYLDIDSDGDGIFDVNEGNDWNLDGNLTETVTLQTTSPDDDNDGLNRRFDTLVGPNVTSRLLGNGGSFTGPTPGNYGTRAVVSRASGAPIPTDRRWRNAPGILTITRIILQTDVNNNGKQSKSNWSYDKKVGFCTVFFQRSIDGINFETINTDIIGIIEATERQENYNDNIEIIKAGKIFYRVKIMSADGEFAYSNITQVKNNNVKQDQLLVWPNPASKQFSTQINVAKKGNTSIKVFNAQGQLQTAKQVQLQEGINTINFDCSKWAKGVYIINVDAVSENKIQKLVIQ